MGRSRVGAGEQLREMFAFASAGEQASASQRGQMNDIQRHHRGSAPSHQATAGTMCMAPPTSHHRPKYRTLHALTVSLVVIGAFPGGCVCRPAPVTDLEDAGATLDAGQPDSGAPDAAALDAGANDSGTQSDSGVTDAAAASDASVVGDAGTAGDAGAFDDGGIGDASWTRIDVAQSPPPRRHLAMAFDELRGVSVVFGGYASGPLYFNDTWEWDGTLWRRGQDASPPGSREEAAMAWDGVNGKVLLSGGGFDETTYLWDGMDWSPVPVMTPPPPRKAACIAWDPLRRRVVMFGGYGADIGVVRDTWEWDGTQWTQMDPVTTPTTSGGAMAYDPVVGKIVLVPEAGMINPGTWTWDGAEWTRTVDAPDVTFFSSFTMSLSPFNRVILNGGAGQFLEPKTYGLTGSGWVEIASYPSGRMQHGMAYDSTRNVVVMFGGFGVTWNGQPSSSARDLDETWELR